MRRANPVVNAVPPVRSFLSFSWDFSSGAKNGRHDPIRNGSSTRSFGPLVQGFTQFVAQPVAPQEPLPQNAGDSGKTLPDCADGTTVRDDELVRLRDVLDMKEAPTTIALRRSADNKARCQHLLGELSYEDTAVALEVVQALGPESKAGECTALEVVFRR